MNSDLPLYVEQLLQGKAWLAAFPSLQEGCLRATLGDGVVGTGWSGQGGQPLAFSVAVCITHFCSITYSLSGAYFFQKILFNV